MSSLNKLLAVSTKNGIKTIKMTNPKKLNAWTFPTITSIAQELKQATEDAGTKAVILTGEDPYYCAGVELSQVFKPMSPKKLVRLMADSNRSLFEVFLDFKKPIIAAVNGPAIGASVTSATLCDAIVASEKATFLTPFGKLGITPEGCSSVHFERLIGKEMAAKMLHEDYKLGAAEALQCKFVTQVAKHEELQDAAQALAETIVQEGRSRSAMGFSDFDNLKAVNIRESEDLARAFLSYKFLNNQHIFLSSKGKTFPAAVFKTLAATHSLWSRFV